MCDDLKKLFGIYNTLDGVVAHIQYVRSERVDEDSSDSQIPKRLDAFFDIDYYQDRYVPTITA